MDYLEETLISLKLFLQSVPFDRLEQRQNGSRSAFKFKTILDVL